MLYCPSSTSCPRALDSFCPSPGHPARYFTEIILNGNLVIPQCNPPIGNILQVTHEIMLRDIETIPVVLPGATTPAGYKIVASGTITLNIQYVADIQDQKVFAVHYELPFNAIIMRDCSLNTSVFLIPPGDPILPDNFVPHVCVEKVRANQIDRRTLSKEVVLMVWIEQKP